MWTVVKWGLGLFAVRTIYLGLCVWAEGWEVLTEETFDIEKKVYRKLTWAAMGEKNRARITEMMEKEKKP